MTRAQAIATGATDGSIIAAIIVTQNATKSGKAMPIVPVPEPMAPARWIVTNQASTASSSRIDQATTLSRLGRARGACDTSGPSWLSLIALPFGDAII